MTRYVRLTAAGLCMSLASAFAPARALADEPGPPPPPVEEQQVEVQRSPSPEAQQREEESGVQRAEPRRERAPERDRIRAEAERQRRDFERERDRADHGRERIERRHRDLERFFRRPIPPPGPELGPDSAWLGVQLSPVPASLAYHLDLKDHGVMIANIFEDSPAEQAGLDRYDIIIKADGKPTPGGPDAIHRFSEIVRDKTPGDALDLTVISRGQEKTLSVILGEPPEDWRRLKPKYEEDPDVAYERAFGLRGRILRPGPHGWIMEDLEAFPGFREFLDREFRHDRNRPPERAVPGEPGRPDEDGRPGEAHPSQSEEARRVDAQGNTLHVKRDKNGVITVQRKQAGDAEAESQTYANMEALREHDKEAYDLLQSAIPRRDSRRPERRGDFAGPARPVRPAPPERPARPRGEPPPPAAAIPPASVRYEVSADGTITVHIREGDAEMSRTFTSREDLRDKAPNLFERYEELEARFGE